MCWRLLYRLDVTKELDRYDEFEACRRARMAVSVWDLYKAAYPREWAKLLAKRQRRLAWFLLYGSIPNGWTPPDPKDPRRTSNRPIHAYLRRRGMTLYDFLEKNGHIPLGGKTGGKQPNWAVIERVQAWLAEKNL